MVIYLDQYRITKTEPPVNVLRNGTYGNEILNVNCNPVLMLLAPNTHKDWSFKDLATADIETILGNIYAIATQI
jgi:hypothetical protein